MDSRLLGNDGGGRVGEAEDAGDVTHGRTLDKYVEDLETFMVTQSVHTPSKAQGKRIELPLTGEMGATRISAMAKRLRYR